MNNQNRTKIAVLGSGKGTNFRAIHNAILAGTLSNYDLQLVVSDVETAPILKHASELGIAAKFVNPDSFKNRDDHDTALKNLLKGADIDLVCLAGYMRLLRKNFVRFFWRRITNLHPSLLPDFRGRFPIERALAARKTVVGATVHYVDEGMDTGEIIAQTRMQVNPGDSPSKVIEKLQPLEHKLYIHALKKIGSS